MKQDFFSILSNIIDLEESEKYSEAIFEIEKCSKNFSNNKNLLESIRLRIQNKIDNNLLEKAEFNEKIYLNSPLEYLALNKDLYTLIDKNDTIDTLQNKLLNHYEKYGKNEKWRDINIKSSVRKNYKEASEKEYSDLKKLYFRLAKEEFKSFCKSNEFIQINNEGKLNVSIIIILHNKDALTYKCLKSISEIRNANIELVIIDNNSIDNTDLLLSKLKGNIKIIKNKSNLHFVKSVNQALEIASKEFIALVNNDTILDPLILSNAYKTASSISSDSIIGGMVMHLDGRIQDAGSIVFEDGSCIGLGRRSTPNCSLYTFKRTVDYISGCFLFCKKNVFENLNGFDTRFAPAYFEEVDFCFRFKANNGKVIYQPDCKLWHFEYGSDSGNSKIDLMQKNRKIFYEIHYQTIKNKLTRSSFDDTNISSLMYGHLEEGSKILIIDDKFPSTTMGAGFGRAADILEILQKKSVFVSYYLTNHDESNDEIQNTNHFNVEVINGILDCSEELSNLLINRQDFYTRIIVSRAHNHNTFIKVIQKLPDNCKTKIIEKTIIDVESLFSVRNGVLQYHKNNKVLPNSNSQIPDLEKKVEKELLGFSDFSRFYAVSRVEKELLINSSKLKPNSQIFLVPCVMKVKNIKNNYTEFLKRDQIGFLGAFTDINSPNMDSIRWLNKEIIHHINNIKPLKSIKVAGYSSKECKLFLDEVKENHENFEYLGKIDDLSKFFSKLKVFIVPTRVGAGISIKLHLAASFGIPIITTNIIASQMSLNSEEEVLTANNSEEFAHKINLIFNDYEIWKRLSNNSINITLRDCNYSNWEKNIINSII